MLNTSKPDDTGEMTAVDEYAMGAADRQRDIVKIITAHKAAYAGQLDTYLAVNETLAHILGCIERGEFGAT